MVAWDDEFCAQIAARGYSRRPLRQSRRRALSTDVTRCARRELMALLGQKQLMGKTIAAPYALNDMAADVVGLLDASGHCARPYRGRVDGRDDRAGDGDPLFATAADVDVHHVVDRQSDAAASDARGDGRAALAAAAHPRGLCRVVPEDVARAARRSTSPTRSARIFHAPKRRSSAGKIRWA